MFQNFWGVLTSTNKAFTVDVCTYQICIIDAQNTSLGLSGNELVLCHRTTQPRVEWIPVKPFEPLVLFSPLAGPTL